MASEVVSQTINNNNDIKLNEKIEPKSDQQLSEDLNKKCTVQQSDLNGKNHDKKGQNGSSSSLIDIKQKRKIDKVIDGILKKGQYHSIEDKYYGISQRFISLQDDNKTKESKIKEVERQAHNANKQRDQIQNEYSKALIAKSKLESLCRELQKHNKLIKDENLQRIKDEEEKRKEITSKFQGAIDDINSQVNSNTDKNNTLIEENVQLAAKLKSLLEQYETREEHVEKVIKHKELELQLADAKLQQSELKFTEITERSKKEKEIYEAHNTELVKKCAFHIEAEKQLKSQLSMYTSKYEDFQSTLTKSNQVFESFRTEMDKMTKKIKRLDQENNAWKNKFEATHKKLATTNETRELLEKELKKVNNKADMMEQLSRTLQTERNNLKEQIKQLTPPPTTPVDDNSEDKKEQVSINDKVDNKTATE